MYQINKLNYPIINQSVSSSSYCIDDLNKFFSASFIYFVGFIYNLDITSNRLAFDKILNISSDAATSIGVKPFLFLMLRLKRYLKSN